MSFNRALKRVVKRSAKENNVNGGCVRKLQLTDETLGGHYLLYFTS